MSLKRKSLPLLFTLFSVLAYLVCSCSPKFLSTTVDKSKSSDYKYAQVEPSIAVNPRNPMELIAGTVLNDYYTSTDGGKTWKAMVLTSPHGVNGDPVLLIDKNGYYYYFHLSNPKDGKWLDRIVCQRTDNIQAPMKTVGHTKVNGKVHDKHWATIDDNTNTIHLAWTQFDGYKSKNPADSSVIVYSNSKDFGETWSEPIRISKRAGNCLDDSGTIEGVSICMGLFGEVYVAYSLNEKIYMNVSADGGLTWLADDREIADQPGGWDFEIPGIYRMNGFANLQVDQSGSPYRGRMYLSWSDQRNGKKNTDVWLIYSDDQGQTWSPIKKVNNDFGSRHQFMNTMRLDPSSGTIAALFYDRRNHVDIATDVYLAYSQDGGETFKNIKLNKRAFVPDSKVFFGDYLALTILGNAVYAMWPEMHKGKISLKFARVHLNANANRSVRSRM
jgi:hypothetical protein